MKSLIVAVAALAAFAGAAHADPKGDRQAIMKDRGAQLRVLAPIAQGKEAFDAAAVMGALEKLNANADKTDVAKLWPAGSGADSKSSPKIWEDMAGFQAAEKKFEDAVKAAVAAKPADLAAFQKVFGPIGASCGTCHQGYRL